MSAEGDVILTSFPQADGQVKVRPALILRRMPRFGDLLICGISTQLHYAVANFDEVIEPADADFSASGLKAPSLLRLGFLAVLPAGKSLGRIGSVADERRQRLVGNLCRHLVGGKA
jgi:mRNA interferase MazF